MKSIEKFNSINVDVARIVRKDNDQVVTVLLVLFGFFVFKSRCCNCRHLLFSDADRNIHLKTPFRLKNQKNAYLHY
jgi:hypothetical protein